LGVEIKEQELHNQLFIFDKVH